MSLESLEKLREFAVNKHNMLTGHGDSWLYEFADGGREVLGIADAVQAEVDEFYCKLPLDADGVPIHVGDEVVWDGDRYTVTAVGKRVLLGFSSHESAAHPKPDEVSHHKQRTVEDVLKAFFHDASDADAFCTVRIDDVIEKYAAELRMRTADSR